MNPTPNRSAPAPRFRGLVVIWMAIISSLVFMFLITLFISRPEGGGVSAFPLFWVFVALALTTFGVSFLLKSKLLAQAAAERKPELVSTAYILAFALAEAAGLFGLMAHFVTGSPYAAYLFALGALGLLLHKPKQAHLLDATGGQTIEGSDSSFGRNG